MTGRTVAISGASSGIGRALAEFYARPGTRIVLIGRDAVRLEAARGLCAAKGAEAVMLQADVRDTVALDGHLQALDAQAPFDLVVANAGVALPEDDVAATRAVIDTNLLGALNVVMPVLEPMRRRGRGQVALISSVAALAPLPDAPAYSASKAALLAYGLALRERLAPEGVRVSVACPGFVRTGMGERYRGSRPWEMSGEEAARRIARGLERDAAVIAFPLPLVLLAHGSRLLPERLRHRLARGFRFAIDPAPVG